jgi:hypothetical protein
MSVAATFTGGTPEEAVAFLAEQRQRLKPFRRVVVAPDRTRVVDVNRSEVIFPGVTFGHPLLETVLRGAGASFDPAKTREFGCTARYPWAHDRIL